MHHFAHMRLLDEQIDIEDGYLIVSEGEIQEVGAWSDLSPEQQTEPSWEDLSGHWLTPGFCNSHTHVAMSFMRDVAHDQPQMIESLFFPVEKELTAEDISIFSYPSIAASVQSGVTSFVDHYYHIEAVGEALTHVGARGFLAETLADLGGAMPSRKPLDQVLQAQQWSQDPKQLQRFLLGPHAMNTVSRDYAEEISQRSSDNGTPIHMHLAQSQLENEFCKKQHQATAVEVAEQTGLLSERTLAVHLIKANKDDQLKLKKTGTFVGLCPTSQILYEHLAPINEFQDSGLKGLLGTDCAASHDSMDILSELRTLYLLHRHEQKNLSAKQILATVWSGPAQWLKLPIGALKPKHFADFVIFKPDLSSTPSYSPLTHLIMSLSSRHVSQVVVAGETIYKKGQGLCKIDEQEQRDRFYTQLKTKNLLAKIQKHL